MLSTATTTASGAARKQKWLRQTAGRRVKQYGCLTELWTRQSRSPRNQCEHDKYHMNSDREQPRCAESHTVRHKIISQSTDRGGPLLPIPNPAHWPMRAAAANPDRAGRID